MNWRDSQQLERLTVLFLVWRAMELGVLEITQKNNVITISSGGLWSQAPVAPVWDMHRHEQLFRVSSLYPNFAAQIFGQRRLQPISIGALLESGEICLDTYEGFSFPTTRREMRHKVYKYICEGLLVPCSCSTVFISLRVRNILQREQGP